VKEQLDREVPLTRLPVSREGVRDYVKHVDELQEERQLVLRAYHLNEDAFEGVDTEEMVTQRVLELTSGRDLPKTDPE